MAKTTAKNSRNTSAPVSLDDGVDALLAQLTGADDEIVERALTDQAQEDDALLEALGADTESVVLTADEMDHAVGRVEAIQASIDLATPTGVVSTAAPTGDSSDAAPLAAGEEGDGIASPAAAKTKTPRKHYANKLDRIKDRLGSGAADYMVLTMDDAGVDAEDLQRVMADTEHIIAGLNKKEQSRAGFLFDFLSGKSAKLSSVLDATLRILHRDGFVTTGKTSNIIADLTSGSKSYSLGSARAMSGNTIGMFHDLKLLKEDGKGKFVANPDSTLLSAANAKLGLAATA